MDFLVTVNSDGITSGAGGGITLEINISGAAQEGTVTAAGSTCTVVDAQNIDCDVANFLAAGSKTVSFSARLTVVGTALVGAVIDPPINGSGVGEEDEGVGAGDFADDEGDDDGAVDCSGVGEGTDGGTATEPDNFDCVATTVANADLTITKTAEPASGTTVGQTTLIYYTLVVANAVSATGSAMDVNVRDTLGTGLTLFSINESSANVTCVQANPVNCTVDVLTPGATETIQVVATVTASSGTVLNGARVDRANIIGESNDDADDPDLDCSTVDEGTDTDPAVEPDNYDCTSHAVGAQVDLTITKTASPSSGTSVDTGNTITYTITVNAIGAAATNVPIRDTVGSGLTLTGVTPGAGVTCADVTGPEINCTAATIAAGSSVTVTVATTVAATSGTVLNGARVDPVNTIAEANEDADDEALDCAAVGEGSDTGLDTEQDNFDCTSHSIGGLNLSVSKSASPSDGSSVATGGAITYTITVSASGTAASNVAIRDTIGTGLSLTSVTPGTGVTCADTTAPEINCTAASIAAGSSVAVTVATTVTATSGTVLNGARVDPAGAITETNEDADDPSLECTAVGEGTDTGDATEPDNFDCTSHTVGAGAAGTRTLNLSPAGWHNFVWTGASGTAADTALTCISGKFQIAYEHTSLGVFQRFVAGHPELSNMSPLTQYDPLLVFITAEGVTCVMPVVS
jgi:uncharacterized repeat protein (TIGR01451 family)